MAVVSMSGAEHIVEGKLVTVLAYLVVVLAMLLGWPSRGVLVLGARLTRLPQRFVAPLVAAVVTWSAISCAWRVVEGDQIPLLLLVAAYLWVGWAAQRQNVDPGGVVVALAEQSGIVLVALAGAIMAGGVRWW